MVQIEIFLGNLANFLWGNWLMFALIGIGVIYSFATGWIQIRKFPYVMKKFFKNSKEKSNESYNDKEITGFQALLTALGSCIGSGNIVGVSTAIIAGGAGALFWMWVAAFFGMATKFSEIVLGMTYRARDKKGNYIGAPMYYIAHGLKSSALGGTVAVLLFIQNAGGTLIQSNTIANIVNRAFHIPYIITGCIIAGVMIYIIRGGFIRLAQIAQKIVPLMVFLYILGGIIVVLFNITAVPDVVEKIFTQAFTFKAGAGAAGGITIREAMRYGVARGLYSNEAGEGTAAVIHSTSNSENPIEQGLYGIVEVFVDTIIVCSTTGFALLCSGVTLQGANAATIAAEAFSSVFAPMGYVVNICLILFASTSLMSQWYFGHVSLLYLHSELGAKIYKVLFPLAIIIGSLSSVNMVWYIQDCALGLLIIPNILALLIFMPTIRKNTKKYFSEHRRN